MARIQGSRVLIRGSLLNYDLFPTQLKIRYCDNPEEVLFSTPKNVLHKHPIFNKERTKII